MQYKNEAKVAIELLDTDSDGSEDPVEVERWSEYVEKYIGDDFVSDELKEQLSRKPVFLPRYGWNRLRSLKYFFCEVGESNSFFFLPSNACCRNIRTWRLRAKKQNLKRLEERKQKERSDSSDDMVDKVESMDVEKSLEVPDDLDIMDNTQCKFNLNSFKMVFVVNSESYLYKHMALKRASSVSSFFRSLRNIPSASFLGK